MNNLKHVLIYTDGACDPNPNGRGGYGIILDYKGNRKEIFGGFKSTTNNRMEVYAAIKALESLKEACQITLYSDSKYLVDAIQQGWAKRWKENNWWRNKKERAINSDLWEQLLLLCEKHKIEFVWVEGHSGHPENERCDYLASKAIKQSSLPDDLGYINRKEETSQLHTITKEGQMCRKCSTPVIKRTLNPEKIQKKINKLQVGKQDSYFEWSLICPKCRTIYLVEEARKTIGDIQKDGHGFFIS